jgi:hypothetical protein
VRAAALLLAAICLLAAGCGGGGDGESTAAAPPPLTKAQYQAKLQQLSNQIGAELRQSIGASTNLKKSDVPRLQEALRSFARKIEALNPPAAVEDLHAQLVVAMRGLADGLPSLIATLDQAKDPAAAIEALFGAKPIRALIRLQQEFKDKGYDISSLLNAGAGP